jgi:hypothetical protein
MYSPIGSHYLGYRATVEKEVFLRPPYKHALFNAAVQVEVEVEVEVDVYDVTASVPKIQMFKL